MGLTLKAYLRPVAPMGRCDSSPAGTSPMIGSTVTRADLAEAVHEEVGLTRQDCAELVERTLELTAQALERGEQVKLSGFGVFQVRDKRARMGRNPKTGEPAAIEPRRVIGFRASQVMKARIDRALSK